MAGTLWVSCIPPFQNLGLKVVPPSRKRKGTDTVSAMPKKNQPNQVLAVALCTWLFRYLKAWVLASFSSLSWTKYQNNAFFCKMRMIRIRRVAELAFSSDLPLVSCISKGKTFRGSHLQMFFNPLKSDSHVPKKFFYLLRWKPFKNDKKCFSFHLKNPFRSQDI